MRSLLSLALSAAVLAVCTASPASAGDVKIGWHGQSFFQIVTPKGARIVLDPHNIESYRITPIKADLVLMSHFHNDHNQIEGVIENKDFKSFNALKKSGPNNSVIDWNLMKDALQDVKFFSIATYHDSQSGMKHGKNGCWVMDIDGIRVVHLGDLGHKLNDKQLKQFGEVDVLMIPVGGVYTLNGIEAFAVVQQIKPKHYVIPMHYGTPVFDDLLPVSYFLDEAKENDVPIERIKDRQWLTIDTKSAAPKKGPSIALMSFQGPGMNEIVIKPKDKDKDKGKEKDKEKDK